MDIINLLVKFLPLLVNLRRMLFLSGLKSRTLGSLKRPFIWVFFKTTLCTSQTHFSLYKLTQVAKVTQHTSGLNPPWIGLLPYPLRATLRFNVCMNIPCWIKSPSSQNKYQWGSRIMTYKSFKLYFGSGNLMCPFFPAKITQFPNFSLPRNILFADSLALMNSFCLWLKLWTEK